MLLKICPYWKAGSYVQSFLIIDINIDWKTEQIIPSKQKYFNNNVYSKVVNEPILKQDFIFKIVQDWMCLLRILSMVFQLMFCKGNICLEVYILTYFCEQYNNKPWYSIKQTKYSWYLSKGPNSSLIKDLENLSTMIKGIIWTTNHGYGVNSNIQHKFDDKLPIGQFS